MLHKLKKEQTGLVILKNKLEEYRKAGLWKDQFSDLISGVNKHQEKIIKIIGEINQEVKFLKSLDYISEDVLHFHKQVLKECEQTLNYVDICDYIEEPDYDDIPF